jgi:hypothetical protein
MEKKALNATTVTESFSHSDRNDSGNLIKGQGLAFGIIVPGKSCLQICNIFF